MAVSPAPPSRFASRVRAEMDAQSLSVRALARRIDPANLDRARRNLHRWLDEGMSPSRTSRVGVARALGIDPSELEDDDEESDPVADLYKAFERFIDHVQWGRRSAASESGGPG